MSVFYFFIDTSISKHVDIFSISASAWGQARSKLGGVDTSILHHAFISIFIALWAVITRYVTILMAILFYFTRFNMKRENADSWDSGLEKEQILETYSAQLQKSWNSTKVIFGINDNYWAEEVPEGAHTLATRVGGAPTPTRRAPCLVGPLVALRCPSSAIWRLLPRKKIISKLTRRNSAATRRNQSRAPAELFCRGNFPLGGGNQHHRHHQRSCHREGVNLHQHLH